MQDTFMYKPTSPRLFSYNLMIHNFEWHVEWQIGLEFDFSPGFLFVESVLPFANKIKLSIPPHKHVSDFHKKHAQISLTRIYPRIFRIPKILDLSQSHLEPLGWEKLTDMITIDFVSQEQMLNFPWHQHRQIFTVLLTRPTAVVYIYTHWNFHDLSLVTFPLYCSSIV